MEDKRNNRDMAEHLRKAYKELRWAADNIAKIYEMVRPDNMQPIEDPKQLKLFEDERQ